MPLDQLKELYQLFSLGLPTKETEATLINIDGSIIEANEIPKVKSPEFNSDYITLEAANDALKNLNLNIDINNLN